jgi:hypothetical protein
MGDCLEKIDYKKELKELYRPSTKRPVIVDVPNMRFLMVDGKGDPNTAMEYQDAIEALYSVSYTLKFKVKTLGLLNYVVMPLEGLWWLEGSKEIDMTRKDDWSWTAMIMQPDVITKSHFESSIEEVREKRNPPALTKVRLEEYHEGLSVQIMYIGPYSEEAPTIKSLHSFAEEEGYTRRGKHHEIYLGDPRRTAPEKLKTVIRQPVGE